MATWTPVDFQVAEAQRLADLTGISADLHATASICQTYLSFEEKEASSDLWHKMSLSMAAVVMYMRTATSGVRQGVTAAQLDDLPQDLRQVHHHVKDLRDKWVAHSVNALEETNVVVYPVPEGKGDRGITQVTTQHRFTCTLSFAEVEQLLTLATTLKKIIEAAAEAEKASLLELARSLPVDHFYDEPERYKLRRNPQSIGAARPRYGS